MKMATSRSEPPYRELGDQMSLCHAGGPGFESRRLRQLNTIISRIPPLSPIVLWFILGVSNPGNRFNILEPEFHGCNEAQLGSVFDRQWARATRF